MHSHIMYRIVVEKYMYVIITFIVTMTLNAGFTSDGEYNSMRNRGYTRPLSVFQIRADVRASTLLYVPMNTTVTVLAIFI